MLGGCERTWRAVWVMLAFTERFPSDQDWLDACASVLAVWPPPDASTSAQRLGTKPVPAVAAKELLEEVELL